MKYRQLGQTDLRVSELALGTMTFGEQNTESASHRQLDIALEAGINLIDTAEMYPVPPTADTCGLSETHIGTWLNCSGHRDKIILATKAAGPGVHLPYIRRGESKHSTDHLSAALNGSLQRLQTDFIDIYQLHWPDRPTNTFGQLGYKPAQTEIPPHIEATLRGLDSLITAGKVRYIGLSNETPWGLMSFIHLAEHCGLARVVAIQNPYNLLNRAFEVGLAEIADRERVGLLAYSPLGFGTLTGKYAGNRSPVSARINRYNRFVRYNTERGAVATSHYLELARQFGFDPAHMAISFILSRRYVASALIGATNETQLRHNLASIEFPLPKELLKAIDKIHAEIPNPCP